GAQETVEKAAVPTARARSFSEVRDAVAYLDELNAPYVIKADGLAAGKGVYICADRDDAVRALEECLVASRFGKAGATVVVEEFLHGAELSLFCLTDGRAVLPLVAAQGFSRGLAGDGG